MNDNWRERPARSAATLAAFAAILALVTAGAARPEKLALQDGSWIEIRGTARTEHGRVVFLTVEGNLRSLPLAEVATREASESSNEAARARLREYPRGTPLVFEEPRPPAPPPLPRRPGAPTLPPGCVLGNARPGDPPALVCVAREPRRAPATVDVERQDPG